MKEVVLYYNPGNAPKPALMKSVLVRMGIRIKNVTNEQTGETIGSLLGMEQQGNPDEAGEKTDGAIEEQMLVLHQFTERRLDSAFVPAQKGRCSKD